MYALTSIPLVSLTLATFLRAELGFFGVCVLTWTHTPRFWGDPAPRRPRFFRELKVYRKAGALSFLCLDFLPLRTSWLTVGIPTLCYMRT
jgi:hypothetical protein